VLVLRRGGGVWWWRDGAFASRGRSNGDMHGLVTTTPSPPKVMINSSKEFSPHPNYVTHAPLDSYRTFPDHEHRLLLTCALFPKMGRVLAVFFSLNLK
jgi:hypothetical protein